MGILSVVCQNQVKKKKKEKKLSICHGESVNNPTDHIKVKPGQGIGNVSLALGMEDWGLLQVRAGCGILASAVSYFIYTGTCHFQKEFLFKTKKSILSQMANQNN